jgi:hypothetical protein
MEVAMGVQSRQKREARGNNREVSAVDSVTVAQSFPVARKPRWDIARLKSKGVDKFTLAVLEIIIAMDNVIDEASKVGKLGKWK